MNPFRKVNLADVVIFLGMLVNVVVIGMIMTYYVF